MEGADAYMYEGSGDKDTSAKVFCKEEDLWRNVHPCDLLCYDWETAASNTGSEHND
jgi:hypothetical protein